MNKDDVIKLIEKLCPNASLFKSNKGVWWCFEPSNEGHIRIYYNKIYIPYDLTFHEEHFHSLKEDKNFTHTWDDSLQIELTEENKELIATKLVDINKRYKELKIELKKKDIQKDFV